MTAMTGVFFGVAPAFRATRVAPIAAVNAHGFTFGERHAMLFNSVIVAQVVFSVVLIVTAGLFVQTFQRLARVSLGFEREGVVVVSVSAPMVAAGERPRSFDRLVHAAVSVPGVPRNGGK